MKTEKVGAHDPMVFGGTLGIWVECECGWIGPGCFSEFSALAAHGQHVSSVSPREGTQNAND